MNYLRLTSLLSMAFLATTMAFAQGQNNDTAPNGKGIGTIQHPGQSSNAPGQNRAPAGGNGNAGNTNNGIFYHGGPVMTATKNVYLIWYGDWSNNTATTILPDMISHIGGSSYFKINTTYTDGNGAAVSNSVVLAGQATDSANAPYSTSLSDSDILAIVKRNYSTTDPNGVYFVLTSKDVNENTGFCTQYCGWHSASTSNGVTTKYSFVGNPERCPTSCAELTSSSPNGNIGADGMASIIAHELQEAATDPNLNAWYDRRGEENADKCAWTFGTTSPSTNGSVYNVTFGGRQYLIQRNWVNASGGYCSMGIN